MTDIDTILADIEELRADYQAESRETLGDDMQRYGETQGAREALTRALGIIRDAQAAEAAPDADAAHRADHDDLDFDACECETPLVASQEADWKLGNPTGYYCEKCGYTFGFRGGYEP